MEDVDLYIMQNEKFFPDGKMQFIREKLMQMPEKKFKLLLGITFIDPTTTLITSFLLGLWGIDRFMLGDTATGVLKLLTCGCCGIMYIIDWFIIVNSTKEKNFNKLMQFL